MVAKSGTTSLLAKVREFQRRKHFKAYCIKKHALGVDYQFLIGDMAGEHWYSERDQNSKNHFDSGLVEMEFMSNQMLSSDDVVFECGAHHGWTTLQIASRLENGKLIAFEPNRKNFEILQKNLELNDCGNHIRPVWSALSSVSGRTRIYEKSNGSVVPPVRALFSRRMLNVVYGIADVPCVTLDDYASENGLMPTFLKIDVEGFECTVLAGARKVLATRPKLLIEVHTEHLGLYGGSVEQILSLVQIDGYRVWLYRDGAKWPEEVSQIDPESIRDRVHLFALPLA